MGKSPMANKTKKNKTTTAKRNASNTQARQNSSTANNAWSNNAWTDAASANGFNPSQFFNLNAFQNFQPANLQQLVEQVIETSQKNLEAVTACTQLYVEHAKDLLEEQTSFATTLLQETATTVQDAFSSTNTDPRNKLEDMADLARYCLDQSTKQARKAAANNVEIAQTISDKLARRLTATVDELRAAA